MNQPTDVSHKAIWLRALGASVLLSAVGLPESVEAYIGCAQGCNGYYCWGDTTPPGKVGCMDGLPVDPYCVTYYSPMCAC